MLEEEKNLDDNVVPFMNKEMFKEAFERCNRFKKAEMIEGCLSGNSSEEDDLKSEGD